MPRKLSFKRFFRINRTFVFFALLIFGLTGAMILTDWYFSISNIEIISHEAIKPKGVDGILGKNLLILLSQQLEDSIRENNPEIRKITIRKKYPSTLSLIIEISKPQAALKADQGFFLLSETGRILQKTKQKKVSLPTILYYQKLSFPAYTAGEDIEFRDILNALHFLKQAKDLNLQINSIDISGVNMIRLQLKDSVLIFTTEKKLETQDYQLEKLVHQFKVEGKEFQLIDLRFDRPVIKLK